jgi:predicted RNA-binding Zn-ribbon protein involved in translation (DUF1610 family)
MKGFVGICPVCEDVVAIKKQMLFFGCPHCKQKISTNEARTRLNIICADPVESEEMLKHCVDLEQRYGSEVPLEILLQIQAHHPHNEAVAYSIVRMSGYRSDFVRQYLKNFCPAKKQVPFAEDFLDNTLKPQYAPLVNYFSQYIENKLPESKQKKYRELLNELKNNYVGRSVDGEGMGLMYVYYCVGTALNVGLLILFILLSWAVYFYLMLAVAVFVVEIFVLFLHNKTYGNRLEISPREKIYMIVFLCSIVLAIGGVFIGWATPGVV